MLDLVSAIKAGVHPVLVAYVSMLQYFNSNILFQYDDSNL